MKRYRLALVRGLARGAEVATAMIPRGLANGVSGELAALAGSALGGLAGEDHRVGAEQRARGSVLARSLGTVGLRLGRNVVFEGKSRISLGRNVTLYDGVQLCATGAHGSLRIGSHTHIDRNTVVYAQGGVEIGGGCAIAAGVIIYSQTNRFDAAPVEPVIAQGTKYCPVRIGDDVWIGAGAIVLPGAEIGDHAVVAAGAVLRGKIPDWKIAAGVPARIIGDRRDKRGADGRSDRGSAE